MWFIDYLTLTIKKDYLETRDPEQKIMKIRKLIFELFNNKENDVKSYFFWDLKIMPGFNGYSQAIYFDNGLKVLFDGTSEMGIHVIMSGSFLNLFYKTNGEQSETSLKNNIVELVDNFREKYDVKLSRIDITKDIYKPGAYKEFYKQVKIKKQFRTKFKYTSLGQVVDFDDRGTVYLGKREGSTQIKFYDKALEQGITDRDILRFEVEYKKKRAEIAYQSFKNHTIENLILTSFKAVKKLNESHPEREELFPLYKHILEGKTERLLSKTEHKTIDLRWLDVTVIAYVKVLINLLGEDVFKKLLEAKSFNGNIYDRLEGISFDDRILKIGNSERKIV